MDCNLKEKTNKNETIEKEDEKFEDPVESFENQNNNSNTENKEEDPSKAETELKENEDFEENEDKEEMLKLSEEEKKAIIDSVLALKAEGVKDYSSKDFVNALNKFSLCIKNSEQIEQEEKELMAILHCNRGLCFTKTNNEEKALEDYTKSISYNNKYIKSYINRMLIYHKREEWIEALDDFNKIKELDPKYISDYRHLEAELNHKAEIKKKQMTDEVLGKLKDLGNSFLGMFGMNLNNFKMNPSPAGGYNISMEK